MGAHVLKRDHRNARVLVTALLVFVLFCSYVWADVCDLLPGPLTLSQQELTVDGQPILQAPPAASVLGSVEGSKVINTEAAQALVDALVDTPGIGADVSVVIMSREGTVAADREPDTLRQPASTLKTLTAAAAASTLDMGSSLTTAVYLNADDAAHPVLVLKGQGDMLLGPADSDLAHVNGRAGLGTLADRCAQALQGRSIAGVRVVYDPSFFGPERAPASIERNDPDGIYFTPTATMAIDEGRRRSDQDRAANPDGRGLYLPHLDDPEAQAATVFAQRLQERGIAVEGKPSRGQAPSVQALAQVQSAPLSEVMTYMLRASDNTLAELFGRLLALHMGKEDSPQGAVQAVQEALRKLGLPVDHIQLADCSGLSPGSQLSVSTLAAVQRLACDGRHGSLAPLVEGLSVVGLVGTAANRAEGNDANGLVRVKTGSLEDVTALTGNVSRLKGGMLEFAVIVNNPTDMAEAVQAVNTFMAGLTRL